MFSCASAKPFTTVASMKRYLEVGAHITRSTFSPNVCVVKKQLYASRYVSCRLPSYGPGHIYPAHCDLDILATMKKLSIILVLHSASIALPSVMVSEDLGIG
jgi:hypothetical protein